MTDEGPRLGLGLLDPRRGRINESEWSSKLTKCAAQRRLILRVACAVTPKVVVPILFFVTSPLRQFHLSLLLWSCFFTAPSAGCYDRAHAIQGFWQ